MTDGLGWSQMSVQHGSDVDIHVDPTWIGIIYKKIRKDGTGGSKN